ncbi:MAG: hypothetical protein Q9208_007934 [Pyrenodesmia sp. 3 TL-2023]
MLLLTITTSALSYVFSPDSEDGSGNFGAPTAGSGSVWLLRLAMARWRNVVIAQSAVMITLQTTRTITLTSERKFDTSSIMKAVTVTRDIVQSSIYESLSDPVRTFDIHRISHLILWPNPSLVNIEYHFCISGVYILTIGQTNCKLLHFQVSATTFSNALSADHRLPCKLTDFCNNNWLIKPPVGSWHVNYSVQRGRYYLHESSRIHFNLLNILRILFL